MPQSQTSAPALPMVDLESHSHQQSTLQPELPFCAVNQLDFQSSQPPTQSSPPPSTNNPETPLQPQPTSSTFSRQQSQSLPLQPSNLKVKLPESSAAQAQQHIQWKNSVLSFCFSYATAVSLQYAQTNHCQPSIQSNPSLVLLSFLVLLTFSLFLLALFIRPYSNKTSETLEKLGFLVAAAAFCHAIAMPFPLELKCAVFAVVIFFLLLLTTFIYLNRNIT
ncbi:hypothetical protein V6N13_058615 [Hibiscus sabdariffa]|uniref:Uncharacterized protein n=1 Tax=Hibiscus sabdariffa TaxID=183260 RepID=A0ABR2GFJ5_9ROSI